MRGPRWTAPEDDSGLTSGLETHCLSVSLCLSGGDLLTTKKSCPQTTLPSSSQPLTVPSLPGFCCDSLPVFPDKPSPLTVPEEVCSFLTFSVSTTSLSASCSWEGLSATFCYFLFLFPELWSKAEVFDMSGKCFVTQLHLQFLLRLICSALLRQGLIIL